MWILTGCLALLFSLHGSFHLRKVILPCLSSATVDSSLNITSSNSSLSKTRCMHHSSRLCLLASQISWQYLGLVTTQPSLFRHLLMLAIEIEFNSGHLLTSISFSLYEVSSSFSVRTLSMNLSCTSLSVLLREFLCLSNTFPVSRYFLIRRCRDLTKHQAFMQSWSFTSIYIQPTVIVPFAD